MFSKENPAPAGPHRWTKGQPSANPGGRPKGFSRLIREKCGQDGEKLIEFALSVLNGELTITQEKMQAGSGEVLALQIPPTIAERLEALKWLADHGYGKAVASLQLSGPGGGPVQLEASASGAPALNLEAYDDTQLEQLEALLTKGLPPAREPDPSVVEGEIVNNAEG